VQFILRRLAFYVVAAWFAITVNFAIPRVMPGNAVDTMLAKFPQLDANSLHALQAEFGAHSHGSIVSQYFSYLGQLAHGNLGLSVGQYPSTVTSIIGQTLPWTLILVGTATVLSFLQATPYFFLALIIIQLFALDWRIFPFGQGYSLGLQPGFDWPFISSAIAHSVLPALTIILTAIGGWMLQMRNVMLTTISEDYILVAQAKGLSPRRIMFTYGARNAILPNIAGFALSLGFVVAGALVMEIVFSYPGIGLTLFNAVTSNDYPLLQGIFLVISLTVLLASLLADVIYVFADPRVRSGAAY
jgi:peptide/nickel transport system permease protein